MPKSTFSLPQICSDEEVVSTLQRMIESLEGRKVEQKDIVSHFHKRLQELKRLRGELEFVDLVYGW